MEANRLIGRLVKALKERGYPEELTVDNLSVVSERSLLKQVERLLDEFESQTLTKGEADRFSRLEAAGVTEEELFETEQVIIGSLETSIERLGKEIRSFETGAREALPPIQSPELNPAQCPLPAIDHTKFRLEEVYDLMEATKSEYDQLMGIIDDDSRRGLSGYEFETLDEWRAFTLASVDDIEDAWRRLCRSRPIISDCDYFRQERHKFLNSVYSRILNRIEKIQAVRQLSAHIVERVEKGIKQSTDELDRLSSQLCGLLRRVPVALPAYMGSVCDRRLEDYSSINGDDEVVRLDGVRKIQDLPHFELKSLLKDAHDYSIEAVQLAKQLQSFNKH